MALQTAPLARTESAAAAQRPGRPRLPTTTVRIASLGLGYFAAAELGHAISFQGLHQAFATSWPATGVLLAALALNQRAAWPALVTGAFAASILSDALVHDGSLAASAGFAAARGLEAVVGAGLLGRSTRSTLAMSRLGDVLALVRGAVLGPMVGATLGAALATASAAGSYVAAWTVWWFGSAVGVLLSAPVVLSWVRSPSPSVTATRSIRIAEAVLLFAGLALTTEALFGEWLPPPLNVPAFVLPFLVWAALRFGPRSAATALLLIGVIGLWNTASGRGPYIALSSTTMHQFVRAQGTLAVFGVSILVLVAIVAERAQAAAEIRTLQGLIPICAWCKRVRNDVGYWQQIEVYVGSHTGATFTHGICPDCTQRHADPL
jgi:integral membrane sensor domain MASE1